MNTPPPKASAHHGAATFEICLKGHLDMRWRAQLDVPELTHQSNGTTTLGGIVADQAALHGLLQRIRDLGLTLVSLSCIERPLSGSTELRSIQTPTEETK
ncbi:hypothetical protein [Devosia sp.]|uniref:hypothetical protein n=1 Tax=Devosia sp. TaxID=1871048 RepID=UPI003264F4F3